MLRKLLWPPLLLSGILDLSQLASALPLILATQSLLSLNRIPTVRESAIMGRRMLRLEGIGTVATVFQNQSDTSSRVPPSVIGKPLALMEYFADCEKEGNPTILALNVASSIKNAITGSNMTLSVAWHSPNNQPFSAVALPRFSLIGELETIRGHENGDGGLRRCFLEAHPDSILWMPGNAIHESYWARLVVKEIYWVGGFGDRAYIGWIPMKTWASISDEEIAGCKLPGEE